MTRILVALSFAALLAASTRWVGYANQEDPRFTGRSDTLESKDLSIARRSFEPGARTAWHSHEKGQLLYVEEGRLRTQKQGQAVKELGAGESDYTAPNIVHWHGATSDRRLLQINIGFGGETKWLQKVTDAEYGGK